MKTIQLLLVLVLAVLRLDGQQSLLIFFEGSEKRPFYVRMGAKTSASSATGQVYLTDLSEKKYEIYIGFPDDDPTEHRFDITLARSDNSFQLKLGPDNKWTLIDLDANKILAESTQGTPATEYRGVRKTDAFAILMAGVVNDSAVLYTTIPPAPPVVAKTNAKVDDNAPVAGANSRPVIDTPVSVTPNRTDTDTVLAVTQPRSVGDTPLAKVDETAIKPGANSLPGRADSAVSGVIAKEERSANVDSKPPADRKRVDSLTMPLEEKAVVSRVDSVKLDVAAAGNEKPDTPVFVVEKAARIVKVDEKHTAGRLELAYADSNNGKTDTIRISIPEEPEVKQASIRKDTTRVQQEPTVKKDSTPVKWSANPRPLSAPGDSDSGKTSPVMINSDCTSFASEYDVDKLRVKMVSEVTADDRIAAARKIFKTKCFSSRQVRALTELFLNDEGKYKFLEAAYPFVSDSDGFKKLSEVLTDEVYIKRFNTLVRLQ